METVIFIIMLASALFIMSIFLFLGKGSWLIAGYNTASIQEKEKYNEKKLCKAAGVVTLIVSLLLYIMAYLGYKVESAIMEEYQLLPFAVIFIVIVLIAIGFDSFYIKKKCKNK